MKRQMEFLEVEKGTENLKDKLLEEGYLLDFSPIILSPEEAKRKPPILLDLVEDAVILYDKNEFLKSTLED